MNPVVPASNEGPVGVTSPLLDALSALDRSPSQNTNEWARSVPAFSGSPNNLIHLGESPPVMPSSFDDKLAAFGWTTREQRGIPSGYLPSASPPSNKRRPLSYQLDGNAQGFDDHRSQISSYAPRRSSMYSQQSRYSQNPPLPHQAQPHFYGVSDTDIRLPLQGPGVVPGENGYYCGFDSLVVPSQDPLRASENVILSGYEGGLHVHAVSKRGLRKVLSIEALRGGVLNAKILPWTCHGSSSRHVPLIAMVIHGPAWNASETSSAADSEVLDSPPITQNGSIRGSPRLPGQPTPESEPVEFYQTTVEVYSFSTKQHVATLLSLPKIHLTLSASNPSFRAPQAVGSLTIHADCGNVVVASGVTGETWIFRQGDLDSTLANKFKCIGKIWTAVQHGVAESASQQGSINLDLHPTDPSSSRKSYKSSILSLNGRWLAYCPSTPSSQVSLHAAIFGLSPTARIPGLNSQTSPQLPGENCAVETPGSESIVKQLLQKSTQSFIKTGNYLAQQGVQAWNNYMNKPGPNQTGNGSPPYQTHPAMVQQFPPTHGVTVPAPLVTKDPGLISILDLDYLARGSSTSASPHPLATFRVPHGCSFLSFAPNGLALFTASNRGDVQTVWDLMRLQYPKSSFLKAGLVGVATQGPHVRQIAQFSRMTIARIVDVVWTSPHGERAAMVTEPGTVHILDIPASAFTWPPPRRRISPPRSEEVVGGAAGVALTATGVATSAVGSLWNVAGPLVGRRRRSSAGISARAVTAQAGHGTQALAAGISRSVGAATGKMNEMRKSAATKLHLPRSNVIPSRGCVVLLNSKRHDLVIVAGGGIVRLYTIKNRRADRPADQQKALRGANYIDHRLPKLPEFRFSLDHTPDLQQAGDFELAQEEIRWKERSPKVQLYPSRGAESSIPQAEIESNAPYQPFHTDRRISLHVYSQEEPVLDSPSVSAVFAPPRTGVNTSLKSSSLKSAWAFGGPINSTQLNVGPPYNPEDEIDDTVDHRALPLSAIERVVRITDSTENVEQIVITTRRRKIQSHMGESANRSNEEGFFEDDCEVLDFASQRV